MEQGEEVITFLPSFTFDFDPARGIIEDSTLTHRYLWLVYQQSGPLNLEPEGDFCQPEKIGARQKVGSCQRKKRKIKITLFLLSFSP